MDYYLLTDMTARIGYELAVAGAETFRIEETMHRVLLAYGIECETFAIPNCVMVSLEADNGSMRSRAASAPRRPIPPSPRNGWRKHAPPAAPIPSQSIISAISLPRRASALCSAARCATVSAPD